MKKRLMVLLLATVTSVSMLAGCGNVENVDVEVPADLATEVENAVEDAKDAVEEVTEEVSDEEKALKR